MAHRNQNTNAKYLAQFTVSVVFYFVYLLCLCVRVRAYTLVMSMQHMNGENDFMTWLWAECFSLHLFLFEMEI